MPREAALQLYNRPSEKPALDWAWVDSQLEAAGTYWVVARTAGHPHPRPVWGLWHRQRLLLSIGTPVTVRALSSDPVITVHLESGTEVVVLEGLAEGSAADPEVIAEYDRKYDWTYDIAAYGPLTVVIPSAILAWRTAGWAGRDGFRETGRWQFGRPGL